MAEAVKSLQQTQWVAGGWVKVESGAIIEAPVSLTVNGEVWLSFLCTPIDLEALALGFLYNENIITGMEEIADLRVCPERTNVDVWLTKSAEKPQSWRRTSGCTGGYTSASPDRSTNQSPNGFTLAPEAICELITGLTETQDLYRQVGGVHTSALCVGTRLLWTTDDIGRHNTLDKLAGRSLLEPTPAYPRLILSTGRISSDMLQKAARIRALMVISRTAASSMAIELAENLGITLVGYARRDRFTVYAHPHRIVSLPTELCRNGNQ